MTYELFEVKLLRCEKCKKKTPHIRKGYNRVQCTEPNCKLISEYKEVFDFA